MKLVLVGGDTLSQQLVKLLLQKKHELIVIELRKDICEAISSRYQIQVVNGDGTNLAVLRSAQCAGADMLLALTGQDENNLIACELAKRSLGIRMTLAKVNNPKNIDIFKLRQVDSIFSSTLLLAELIEEQIDFPNMRTAFSVPGNSKTILEFRLSPYAEACGQSLLHYKMPKESKLVLLTRENGTVEMPRGDLILQPNDLLLLICDEEDREFIWKTFVHPEQ